VALKFGTFSKMMVQDGLVLIPKEKLDVINPMTKKQKAKGLIPMTIEYGEIMWIHLVLCKMSSGRPSSPSSKTSDATPSFSQQMTTL